jgi:mono/diheme cytochrome c family protein
MPTLGGCVDTVEGDDAPRRSRRRGALAVLGTVALMALPLAGCGGSGGSARAPPARRADIAAARARLMAQGRRIFAEHCQTCHPLAGKPNTHVHTDAPPLNLDEVRPAPSYVAQRLALGGVGMGSFRGELSPAQLRAVRSYILAAGGHAVAVPRDPPAGMLLLGERVFEQHCHVCHGIAGTLEAGNRRTIWPATNLNLVKPSIGFVERIVRSGQREAMPSFRRRLSAPALRAVALYVTTVAGPPSAQAR